MSVDDRENRLDGDPDVMPGGTGETSPPGSPATPPAQRRRRRYLTRRNAILVVIAAAVCTVALVLLLVLVYRLGYVDRYVAGQVKATFSKYGIRAEIKDFHTAFSPQTVEMLGLELYDAQTGEKLGKIDRLLATVRIEDLYALSLKRDINLKDLKIEGIEAWVNFDDQGRSNFRNIHIPPPEPNRRILFSYSTAHVEIQNGVIYYGDARHAISGEARNLQATVQPDDPNAPASSWMNRVTLALANSVFTYDGRAVNNIDVELKGRINQTRAEVQELVLRSPVVEAHLSGTMDDWRALRYQMNVTSSVDLTELSEVLKPETKLVGSGNFAGTVTGEGENYKIQGSIKSDALAADGVRLQGLDVTATATGQGKTYDANGKVIADLLNAGDFQLSSVQMVGRVMGTGADFRWVGELRAAAEKSYGTTIAGLILHDARAEMKDGVLTTSSNRFTANSLRTSGANVNGLTASDIRLRQENSVTTGSIASVKAGAITARDAKINGVTANKIDVSSREGVTSVVVKEVQVGGANAVGAEIGSLNIAGVRLSIRSGRVEGSTADINAGTVKLADGQLDNIKLAKPVFVVEPSGRYRASADLSIGGGVVGRMNMGQARARLLATNSDIQLNDFTADIFKGRASGNARIATTQRGQSQITAQFSDLDLAGPLAMLANSVVPLSGSASGKIDLSFPGTDVKQASGTITTQVIAQSGEPGTIPISGEVRVRADRGLFQIDRADLQTNATKLTATGQFSFSGDSNLQVALSSTDASELQAVLIDSGVLSEVEEQMRSYGLEVAGALSFNGTLTGKFSDPDINGRVSLGSLLVNGTDLGSLSATIAMTPSELRVADGRLAERDGGGIQFSVVAPRPSNTNITVAATLDRANARAIIAALPLNKDLRQQLADTQAEVSGQVRISGIPDAMNGSADLRFGPGKLGGEPLESLVAKATFSGSTVTIENIDARLSAGHLVASGSFDTTSKNFDIQGRAEGIQLSRLSALTKKPAFASLTGVADLTAHLKGSFSAADFSAYDIVFDGQARDVTLNGRSVGLLELTGKTENKQLNVNLKSGLLGTPQVVTAQVNLADPRLAATIEANLNNADLANLLAIAIPSSAVRLTGRASGTFKASGFLLDQDGYFTTEGLQGTATFTELGFKAEEVQLNATTPFTLNFSGNEISFDHTKFTGTGTNVELDGTLALGPGGRQALMIDGRVNLRVLNGLSPDFFSSGTAEVSIRVGGTYTEPRLNGTASLTGATVTLLLGNERWNIQNLEAFLRFTSNQIQIDSATGRLGGGRLTATGGALLDGFTVARFLINLRGENVTAPFPDNFNSTFDADIEIKGTSREQLVSGVVNLRRAEYTQDLELADLINFRRQESIEEGGEIELVRTALFSDLRVEGRNALVVRNNLADLTGSVSLQLNGPVKDPVISGRITATSGTLNFRNDRYEITRALMDMPAQRGADPIINIQAETEIRGYRVIVSLTGPLSQPQAVVRSEPSLPQADVVSLITTGQLTSSDTSASVLSQSGIGTATSLLTDALINAPAQRATSKLFGLTRFEINPVIGRSGSSPAARLTLGRRISKELSVTYSTNVASDPNQILALEYRISDRLSFIAQYEQASTRELSSRNNSFSFEIRFRKRF
jgi:translocation and assembly module TamB